MVKRIEAEGGCRDNHPPPEVSIIHSEHERPENQGDKYTYPDGFQIFILYRLRICLQAQIPLKAVYRRACAIVQSKHQVLQGRSACQVWQHLQFYAIS